MSTCTLHASDFPHIFDLFQKWINQRPGLEPGNYGCAPEQRAYTSREDWRESCASMRSELRSIQKDGTRARRALTIARQFTPNPEAMQAALDHAFSGRLSLERYRTHECWKCGTEKKPYTWDAPVIFSDTTQRLSGERTEFCPKCHKRYDAASPWKLRFDYTTGQYWPTEYRIAAAVVLEEYNEEVRPKTTPGGQIPTSITELQSMNYAAGGKFFTRDNMRFFRSRVLSEVFTGCGGVYFVTSEKKSFDDYRRVFHVRRFDPADGDILSCGHYADYSRSYALRLARELSETWPPKCDECLGEGKLTKTWTTEQETCWMCHGAGHRAAEVVRAAQLESK